MQQQTILIIALVVISVSSILIAMYMQKSHNESPPHMSHVTVGHDGEVEHKKMTMEDYVKSLGPPLEMKKHNTFEYNTATATATDSTTDPISDLTTRLSKVETRLLELQSLGGINREQLKFVTANLNKTVV